MTTTTEISRTNGTATQLAASNQVAPRGPVAPALVTDEHKSILRGMVDRNATSAQIEMLVVIGNRYDLDPLMGHVVLIQGKCFVTHKGLVHKAHTSGQFDGMDTTFGRDDIGEYAESHVWRKDMSRPFVGRIYIDEYANSNPVWKSCRHGMAAKTSESFTLRRAMDVSLTSQEEMGVADALPPPRAFSPEEGAQRKSLSERISGGAKALTAEQFASFKAKVVEMGGLGAMETEDLRGLLDQVEAVTLGNTARDTNTVALPIANTESEINAAEPNINAEAVAVSADEAEDDPFADGPEQ